MYRVRVSDEERLQQLYDNYQEAKRNEPFGFSAKLAQLSYQILKQERKMHIDNPDKRYECIGVMLEHAYYMKTDLKDRAVAKRTFADILKVDRSNAEANYRYAFLYYEDRDWIKAIEFFRASLVDKSSDFPLADDQVVKANLFISYCATMLVRESMRAADSLMNDELLETEGISIDELSENVKMLLDEKEYRLISNEGVSFISKKRYEELENNLKPGEVWLDITAEQPYVENGCYSKVLSRQNASLLIRLLVKSGNKEALSLLEITGYQEELIADSLDISWDSYRQKIRRLNQKLEEIGLPSPFIKHVAGTQSYHIESCPFFIVERDAQ